MNRTQRIVEWLERRVNLTEMFSLLSIFGIFYTEVDTGKPLREAVREALAKPLPSYARWPRALGLLTLILFLLEAVTGVLLAFYYRPTDQEAYQSLLTIVRDVNLGWFIRQMHFWGAQLLVVVLIARLVRFFFAGLYRAPREVIWVATAVMFLLATHLDFSGRLLSWSNESYWTSLRALEILQSLPVAGDLFAFFLGGLDIGPYLLTKFYFLHILVLPLAFWFCLYISFSGIRRVGLASLPGDTRKSGLGAYLGHLYTLVMLVLVTFGLLVTLSVLWPTPFGSPVDFYRTATGTRLPWYLLAPYGFVESLPGWLPLWARSSGLLVALALFLGVPFLRRPRAGEADTPNRKGAIAFGVVVFVLWLTFSWVGWTLDV